MVRSTIESVAIHIVALVLIIMGPIVKGGDSYGYGTGSLSISTSIITGNAGASDEAASLIQEEVSVGTAQQEVIKKMEKKSNSKVVEKEKSKDIVDNEIDKKVEEKIVRNDESGIEIEREKLKTDTDEMNEQDSSQDEYNYESQSDYSQVASIPKQSLDGVVGMEGLGAGGGVGTGSDAQVAGSEQGVISLKDVDTIPRALSNIKPNYPKFAKDNRIEGRVLVRFILNEKGDVESPLVVKASPVNIFETSALKAVSQWKFTPAVKDGVIVRVGMVVSVKFKLEEN